MPSARPIDGRRRSASIRITLVAGERERGGEVDRRRRLALGRRGAGDRAASAGRTPRRARPTAWRAACGRPRSSPATAGSGRSGVLSRERLARHAREHRQPQQPADLLLAPQPRVEQLERERADDAEQQADDQAGDDAQDRPRGDRRGRAGRPGSARADVGSGPPRSVCELVDLQLERLARRACRRCRRRGGGRAGAGSPRRAACAARSVRSSTIAFAKPFASACASFAVSRGRGDGDDVALRDRLGGDVVEQARAACAVQSEVALHAVGDGAGRDEPRHGLDVTRRVVGLAHERQADERLGVASPPGSRAGPPRPRTPGPRCSRR